MERAGDSRDPQEVNCSESHLDHGSEANDLNSAPRPSNEGNTVDRSSHHGAESLLNLSHAGLATASMTMETSGTVGETLAASGNPAAPPFLPVVADGDAGAGPRPESDYYKWEIVASPVRRRFRRSCRISDETWRLMSEDK